MRSTRLDGGARLIEEPGDGNGGCDDKVLRRRRRSRDAMPRKMLKKRGWMRIGKSVEVSAGGIGSSPAPGPIQSTLLRRACLPCLHASKTWVGTLLTTFQVRCSALSCASLAPKRLSRGLKAWKQPQFCFLTLLHLESGANPVVHIPSGACPRACQGEVLTFLNFTRTQNH